MSTFVAVRRPLLIAAVLVLAGCGSSGTRAPATTTTTAAPPSPPGHVLYQGAEWAVSVSGTTATAYRLVGGAWRADRSGEPRLTILGPQPGSRAARTPQIAFQAVGRTDLADTAIWVDGAEVQGKGGGLSPKQGTVYGAPTAPLRPGRHVAVAYARTATHASAVAWAFHV